MKDATTAAALADLGFALAEEADLADQFVAHRVYPILPVMEESDTLPKIMARRRVQSVKRHRDGSFNRVQTEVGEVRYTCEEAGLEERLPDRDRRKFATNFDAELVVARALAHDLLRARDVSAAASLFTTGTFGSGYNTAATAAWGTGTSDVIKDIESAKDKVRQRIGRFANRMLIGAADYVRLSYDPSVLSQIKNLTAYAGSMDGARGLVPLPLLAMAFGLEEVIIGGGIKDTSQDGATSVTDNIWEHFALVFYSTPTPQNLGDVALGRMFRWDDADQAMSDEATTIDDSPTAGFAVDKYREEHTTSDIIRVREYTDMKILNTDAGHLITGISS